MPVAKLTKANLKQLKEQLHDSLASVNPRFGSDALEFKELVCCFENRIYNDAKERAWNRVLKERKELRKIISSNKLKSCRSQSSLSSRSTRSTQLSTNRSKKSKGSSKDVVKKHKKK
jgi:hypothetical protein